MASNRGKRQEAGQNGDGVPARRGKSTAGGNSAGRSQGRKTRSARKENAAASEASEGLDAGSAAEVTAEANKRPRTAQKVKQECTAKIIAEMGQIVTGLIEKAKRGSYNEAKLLLTIAEKEDGKRAEEKAAQAAADVSLAELLLGQLGGDDKPAAKAKARSSKRKSTGKRRKSGAASKRRRPTAKAPELQEQQASPESAESAGLESGEVNSGSVDV